MIKIIAFFIAMLISGYSYSGERIINEICISNRSATAADRDGKTYYISARVDPDQWPKDTTESRPDNVWRDTEVRVNETRCMEHVRQINKWSGTEIFITVRSKDFGAQATTKIKSDYPNYFEPIHDYRKFIFAGKNPQLYPGSLVKRIGCNDRDASRVGEFHCDQMIIEK